MIMIGHQGLSNLERFFIGSDRGEGRRARPMQRVRPPAENGPSGGRAEERVTGGRRNENGAARRSYLFLSDALLYCMQYIHDRTLFRVRASGIIFL